MDSKREREREKKNRIQFTSLLKWYCFRWYKSLSSYHAGATTIPSFVLDPTYHSLQIDGTYQLILFSQSMVSSSTWKYLSQKRFNMKCFTISPYFTFFLKFFNHFWKTWTLAMVDSIPTSQAEGSHVVSSLVAIRNALRTPGYRKEVGQRRKFFEVFDGDDA